MIKKRVVHKEGAKSIMKSNGDRESESVWPSEGVNKNCGVGVLGVRVRGVELHHNLPLV